MWGPVQNDPKLRISRRWHESINQAQSPSKCEASCTCTGHMPTKLALLVPQLPHPLVLGPPRLILSLLLDLFSPFPLHLPPLLSSSSFSSRHYAKISYLLPGFIFPFALIFSLRYRMASPLKVVSSFFFPTSDFCSDWLEMSQSGFWFLSQET